MAEMFDGVAGQDQLLDILQETVLNMCGTKHGGDIIIIINGDSKQMMRVMMMMI